MTYVLLIEDNMSDARMVEDALKQQGPDTYRLVHVVKISEAIRLLARDLPINIILSDITLPDSQGVQTFTKLRKAASDLPVVFLAGAHDESLAVDALQKGAQDYLLKGQFDRKILVRSLRYAIERKKFENDAKSARSKTRNLQQKTALLKQQKAQLVALNDAKDDFISMASHQLRTPATGVKQYLGMMLAGFVGQLSENQQSLAQNAYESNERQLATIDDLLKVAQLDAGHLTLHETEVDIVVMLEDIIDEQRSKLEERRQPISFEFQKPHAVVEADHKLLRMVFENLVDNASKYTPTGKPLSIRVSKIRSKIMVEVIDGGVGIDKANATKLFQKFSRIKNPLSETVNGSGLGLYWAKKVVDLHRGSITVESALGAGSNFTVLLPSRRDQ